MNSLKISLLVVLLGASQEIFFRAPYLIAQEDTCEPHLSIENQKAKKISAESRDMLKKIMQDREHHNLKENQVFFDWPVQVCKCWISSLFGYRKTGYHHGVDLAAPKTTPVYAAADGVIEIAQLSSDTKGYGNMILMDHQFSDPNGQKMQYKTRYGHLDKILVKQGQKVKQGKKIGTVGATGHVIAKHSKSDPSHLHFEVYRGEKRINPLIVLFASDYAWVKQNLKE